VPSPSRTDIYSIDTLVHPSPSSAIAPQQDELDSSPSLKQGGQKTTLTSVTTDLLNLQLHLVCPFDAANPAPSQPGVMRLFGSAFAAIPVWTESSLSRVKHGSLGKRPLPKWC